MVVAIDRFHCIFFLFSCIIFKVNFQLWGWEMPSCNITPYQWCVYGLLGLSDDLREGLKINKGPLLGYIDSLHFWLPVGLQSIHAVSASIQSTKVFDALSGEFNWNNCEIFLGDSFFSGFTQTKHINIYFITWNYWSVLDLFSFRGVVQERCNSSALAMELRFYCLHPLISSSWFTNTVPYISIWLCYPLPSCSSAWMKKHGFVRAFAVGHQRRAVQKPSKHHGILAAYRCYLLALRAP